LNYPVHLTGFVSKSSHRFIIFLFQIMSIIIFRIHIFHQKKI
jgi:hypothetical protein